jgi:hypothetical protein
MHVQELFNYKQGKHMFVNQGIPDSDSAFTRKRIQKPCTSGEKTLLQGRD